MNNHAASIAVLLTLVPMASFAGNVRTHRPDRVRAKACGGHIVMELDTIARTQGWRVGWLVRDTWSSFEGDCVSMDQYQDFPTPANRKPFATAQALVATHQSLSGEALFDVDELSDDVIVVRQVQSGGQPIDQPWSTAVTLPTEPTSVVQILESFVAGWPGDADPIVTCAPDCKGRLAATQVSYGPGTTMDFAAAVFTILDDAGGPFDWGLTQAEDGAWVFSVSDTTERRRPVTQPTIVTPTP